MLKIPSIWGSQRAPEPISIEHLATTTPLVCNVAQELNSASRNRYNESVSCLCALLPRAISLAENSSVAYLSVLKGCGLEVRQVQLEFFCSFWALVLNMQGLQ